MLVVQHLVFLLCVVVPRADFALSRDVRATLTQLRLSQYASAFEDAEIVAGDLPLLSEEDLAEMTKACFLFLYGAERDTDADDEERLRECFEMLDEDCHGEASFLFAA